MPFWFSEQNLDLSAGGEEDEELPLEDDENSGMTQAMHIIGNTIMTENGLASGVRIISQAEAELMIASQSLGDQTSQQAIESSSLNGEDINELQWISVH